MEEYLNKITEFYNQKLLLLTNKDKNTKCNNCANKIEIEETNKKILLTCGGGNKECRIQYEVIFPEYIYFERDLKKLKDNLEYEINWEVLKKYIDVDDELKEYNERKLYINRLIDEITKKYIEINSTEKIQKIKDLYENREKLKSDCELIMKSLKIKEDASRKKALRQRYVENIKLMNEEYLGNPEKNLFGILQYTTSLDFYTNSLNRNYIKKFIMQKEPNVKITNENYKGTFKVAEIKLDYKDFDYDEDVSIIYYYSKSSEYKWLSTFNIANEFTFNGNEFKTVEHAYQAQKVLDDEDGFNKYHILLNQESDISPETAKSIGKRKYFEENDFTLREDWDLVRLNLMMEITKAYYDVNPEMKKKLIESDNKILIHTGTTIDKYWGVQTKSDNNGYGFGENHHGIILMKLRDIYQQESQYIPKKEPKKPKKEHKKELEDKPKEPNEQKSSKLSLEDLFKLKFPIQVKWMERNKEQTGKITKLDKRAKKMIRIVKSDGKEVKKDINIIKLA
jgi:ribA/ribD-fused uncharacterized protein